MHVAMMPGLAAHRAKGVLAKRIAESCAFWTLRSGIVVQPATVEVATKDDVVELLHWTIRKEFCLQAGGAKGPFEVQFEAMLRTVLGIAAGVSVNSETARAGESRRAVRHQQFDGA